MPDPLASGGCVLITRRSVYLLVLAAALFAACQRYDAIPVPSSHVVFVGTWSSGQNSFRLSPDGTIDLELDGPDASLLVRKGRLRSVEGGNLEVGVGDWQASTHLMISESPYSSPNGQAIQVEGIELYRQELGAPAG